MERKPIATKGMSNFGGIEILEIKYGIEDKVLVADNYGTRSKPYWCKLRESDNGTYFIHNGRREYLSDYMKV